MTDIISSDPISHELHKTKLQGFSFVKSALRILIAVGIFILITMIVVITALFGGGF